MRGIRLFEIVGIWTLERAADLVVDGLADDLFRSLLVDGPLMEVW